VLEKMGAKVQAHNEGVPVVERDTWHLADGFIFGSGTRFGMMTSRECTGRCGSCVRSLRRALSGRRCSLWTFSRVDGRHVCGPLC
jgi:hypothetical protein